MKTHPALFCCRFLHVALLGLLLHAHARAADQTATWNGTIGNWSDFTKWSTNPLFPNNGNGGFTFDAAQNGGTLTVDQAITVEKLTLSGGANTGAGFTLTTNDLFIFSGGVLNGTGIVQADGGVSFNGAVDMTVMDSRNLRLGGDSSWTSGTIRFHSTSSITNEAGNTFTTNFDGSTGIAFGGTGTFNNEGIFTKSGGTGTTSFNNSSFNNTGTVNVNSGTLALPGGGTSTGAFNVSNSTTLSFSGTHTLNAGTAVSGLGTGVVQFSAGTSNFNAGSYSVAGTTQINGGTANFNAAASTNLLSLSSGILGGTGTLTASGLTTFTGGTMSGAGTTQADGGVSFSGAGNMDISTSRTLSLGADSGWTSGIIRVGLSGVLDIQSGTTFDNSFDGTLTNNLGGVATVNNAGTFTKSGGAGITAIGAAGVGAFNNTGTVNVDNGTLSFGFGGTHTGTFNVGAGNTLRLAGGTHALNSGADYNGAGAMEISGATVTVNAPVTMDPAVTFSSGTINGTSTLTTAALLTFTGGTMSDAGITQANGGVSFSGAGNMILFNGRSLKLGDDSTWSSGTLQFHAGAAITNESGNVFTNSFDGNLSITLSGTGGINNEGTFTKSGGTGVTNFDGGVFLNNTGTVNVNSGTLALNTGASTTGTWNVGAGNTLRLAAGTHALNGGADYNGAGMIEISGATVTVNAPVTMDPSVTFSSGTINGTSTLTTAGHLTWTGGTMTDAGVTQADGGVSFSGAGNKILFNGRSLRLGDDSTWSGGPLQFHAGAAITNESGNVFTNTFDGSLSITLSGIGGLNNEGTFTKSGGTGVTNFDGGVFLNNTGTVNANSGTITLQGGVTQHSGTTLTGGTWNVTNGASINITTGSNITTNQGSVMLDGAGSSFNRLTDALSNNQGSFTLKNDRDLTTAGGYTNSGSTRVEDSTTVMTIGAGGSAAYTQTVGETVLVGGAMIDASVFNLDGGELKGNGIIASSVVTGGTQTISPGLSPGVLTINGDLTLSAGSTLTMELGGLNQGTDYDYLDVNGTLTLAGLLDLDFINDFQNTLPNGEMLMLATANNAILGSFANVASGGYVLTSHTIPLQVWYGIDSPYGAENLVVGVPEPSRAMLIMLGLLGLLQRRKRHACAVDSAAL